MAQLEAGIRYFDLRIARKKNDTSNNLYFVHGVYTFVTVQVSEHRLTCYGGALVKLE